MADRSCTTNPHPFVPLRWWDRLLRGAGRCRHCIAPQIAHPMPQWFVCRPLQDGRYYTNEEAHEIYYGEESRRNDGQR